MAAFDVAFEEYRLKKYGAQPYPVDDYTMFGVGWKAAMLAVAEVAEHERRQTRNGGAINSCRRIENACREMSK